MTKVEDDGVIPRPGQKSPESEHLPPTPNSDSQNQPDDSQRLIGIGIALAHALQQLSAKPEN
jgi:hypothetical protein